MKQARKLWQRHFGAIPEGFEVDHRNGNNRDDRLENFRLATRQQNNFNRRTYRNNKSGEKGVIFDKASGRWQVRVFARPIKIYAYASHKISAIVAARLIRRVLHGEFALENRNVPQELIEA